VAGAGTRTILIGTDRTVSGRVTSTGIAGTAAHIHEVAAGKVIQGLANSDLAKIDAA
jgi:hypothetical protein